MRINVVRLNNAGFNSGGVLWYLICTSLISQHTSASIFRTEGQWRPTNTGFLPINLSSQILFDYSDCSPKVLDAFLDPLYSPVL